MSRRGATDYRARDELFLWWVAEPTTPVLVGQLTLVRSPRGVSLRYSSEWCERGFPLSEDLPLLEGQEFLPRERDTAAGAVDDARPDRWGERVIQRFDRSAGGQRRHALSANVALKAAGEALGYPELAQLLRRRGVVAGDRNVAQMHELFRRMVFNILIDNTDDHEKNHALLVDDAVNYELSPAYDVLPSGQALGYQQLRVGQDEADSTLSNALSMCSQFGLKPAAAQAEIARVAKVVGGWREHFASSGVSAGDIELYAEQIDRPFLSDQRDEYAR